MPIHVMPLTKGGLKKLLLLVAVLLLVVVALFPRMKLHVIRAEGGGGVLIWKGSDAYLFLFDRPVGYQLTGAEFLAERSNEYFHAPAAPKNSTHLLTIVHVTAAGTERYLEKSPIGIDSFTPVEGTIYAACPGGICRWNGHRFELVSIDEVQKIGGRERLLSDWQESTGTDGWSRRPIRAFGPGGSEVYGRYSVEGNTQFVLIVTEGDPTSVYLQRPNQPKERLWYHKQSLSFVTKSRYDSVFDAP